VVEILNNRTFLHVLDKIASSPMLLIGTLLVMSFMVGAIEHWLMNRSLLDRQQFNDDRQIYSIEADPKEELNVAHTNGWLVAKSALSAVAFLYPLCETARLKG